MIRRKPKVFISYAHSDRGILEILLARLSPNYEPVIDEIGIREADSFPLTVRRLIDTSDMIIALGTENFMESTWCKQEVEYAIAVNKIYMPVIIGDIDPSAVPRWFTGMEREIVYLVLSADSDFSELIPALIRLTQRAPVRTTVLVGITTIFLGVLPILLSLIIRSHLGMADSYVQRLQVNIEALNERIAGDGSMSSMVTKRKFGKEGIVYLYHYESVSGVLIVRDKFKNGLLNERRYFENDSEIGKDTFTVLKKIVPGKDKEPALSIIKRREIFEGGQLKVEEVFDAVGNLISKRSLERGEGSHTLLTDISSSVYPPMMLIFRY